MPLTRPIPPRRLFRIVPAERLLREFSSDRSHMLRPDGSYSAPPPTYAPIMMGMAQRSSVREALLGCGGPDARTRTRSSSAEPRSNLDEYIDMSSTKRGAVLDTDQFIAMFLATGAADAAHVKSHRPA